MPKKSNAQSTHPQTLILGIDPGFQGALAFYDAEAKLLANVSDMPVSISTGANTLAKKPTKNIHTPSLMDLLEPKLDQIFCAIIEQVSAAPGQGTVSMFRFGEGYGLIKGLLAAYGITTHTVRPNVWKPAMALSGAKNDSLTKARQLLPTQSHYFARAKDDGRAEATLMAIFGARQFYTSIQDLY